MQRTYDVRSPCTRFHDILLSAWQLVNIWMQSVLIISVWQCCYGRSEIWQQQQFFQLHLPALICTAIEHFASGEIWIHKTDAGELINVRHRICKADATSELNFSYGESWCVSEVGRFLLTIVQFVHPIAICQFWHMTALSMSKGKFCQYLFGFNEWYLDNDTVKLQVVFSASLCDGWLLLISGSKV